MIALVDDDESVREALPAWLQQHGYRARAFASAEALLATRVATEASCLILDVAMPGMTGLELHRVLLTRACRVPVVFITAQTDDVIRQQAVRQGAAAVLLKPFSDTILLAALREVMGDV